MLSCSKYVSVSVLIIVIMCNYESHVTTVFRISDIETDFKVFIPLEINGNNEKVSIFLLRLSAFDRRSILQQVNSSMLCELK